MATGKIKFFNRKKGFGYIIDDSSLSDIFVHITAFKCKKEEIKTNDLVTYDISANANGQCAINVVKSNPQN